MTHDLLTGLGWFLNGERKVRNDGTLRQKGNEGTARIGLPDALDHPDALPGADLTRQAGGKCLGQG